MDRHRIANSLFTATAAAACGLALAGCSASIYPEHEHHAYVEHREVVTEAPPPPPPAVVEREGPPVVIERGAVYRPSRYSVVVARGRGKISFNAPERGRLAVVDTNTGRIEVVQEMHRGDRLAFDPVQNKAWLNGHTVLDHDLKSHHVYEMYFEPYR